ncbi:hypothetical protein KSP39_PZI007697 [Platanthera zijinensis]|uniref:Glutaredoxin domain-containing protein n=1 Tax=Platanthera zijinensis TaxID=2320716 RepID=A0AAP0BPI9_9ASPA
MGCASSSYLDGDGDGDAGNLTSGLGHHIVYLTSTTYGLLSTLDSPSLPHAPLPPPLSAISSTISCLSRRRPEPEIINSWELMAGLDPLTPLEPINLEAFERRCPPGGEQAVVLYTTTLRGIRSTFENCNAVRAALEGLGVWFRERDVSMDLGFREELRDLMGGRVAVPRVFVRGRHIGGVEQVMRMHEEGVLGFLVDGLAKSRHVGGACDGCGGARFFPCLRCSGSRKLVLEPAVAEGAKGSGGVRPKGMGVRCPDCNENGLVFCPICT